LSGVFFWRLHEIQNRPPVEIVPDLADKIPLIHFEKIENGIMYGKTGEKEVRFIVGPNKEKAEIYTSQGGEFNFPVIEILPMINKLPSPDWAQFAASSRGTKYWPLDAPEAFMLSAKNRVFFSNSEEAEKAGYKRGQ